jgi:hypothetical protein
MPHYCLLWLLCLMCFPTKLMCHMNPSRTRLVLFHSEPLIAINCSTMVSLVDPEISIIWNNSSQYMVRISCPRSSMSIKIYIVEVCKWNFHVGITPSGDLGGIWVPAARLPSSSFYQPCHLRSVLSKTGGREEGGGEASPLPILWRSGGTPRATWWQSHSLITNPMARCPDLLVQ